MDHAWGGGPYTLADCQKAAEGIGMPADMILAFFEHYDSQGWLKGNGQRITSLPSAMARWKSEQANRKGETSHGSARHSTADERREAERAKEFPEDIIVPRFKCRPRHPRIRETVPGGVPTGPARACSMQR